MSGARDGVVSVVVVNYKGTDDTITCLRSFADVDWPRDRLELIVIDNDSQDGSADRIRSELPNVRVIDAGANLGFAGGCNLGVQHATGEYVGFINNDARPAPHWVSSAVAVMERDRTVACVASKVLDWDGKTIDYVDGSMTFYGMGYKREIGRPDGPEYDHPHDVLFGTGAAEFFRTEVFRQVGGFDERFFMFYEDVDLGWRLNLLGYRVRYDPGSVAYHKHHVSIGRFGQWRENYLLERNALIAMLKNYDDETLRVALPAALLLAVRRSTARGGDDNGVLDLQRTPGVDEDTTLPVSKLTMAGIYAIDSLIDHLPSVLADRAKLQRDRKRSDRELIPLFRQALEPAEGNPRYLSAYQHILQAIGVEEYFSTRRRILVLTGEPITAKLAGPAIRAVEMAAALAAEHEVILGTASVSTLERPDFECRGYVGREMGRLVKWCDVIVAQGLVAASFREIAHSDKVIVVDIYDPIHLEHLEQGKDVGDDVRRQVTRDIVNSLNRQLQRGDFFLAASDKQRDFWLGQLAALGRINPDNYDSDESLESLIAPVPFGIPVEKPVQTKPAIRGVVNGIGAEDKVLLWGGGVYNWFDPLTLLRAVDRLRHRVPEVRLFFLGLRHPNPGVPEMQMAVATRDLADTLGLTDKYVFFNEGWVPYDERANYLLEADVGVSTHLHHIETAFSFRTRILDYLWSGLPVVATGGDTFADLIAAEGIGLTVPPGDVEALEEALYRMLTDDELAASCRANVARVADRFTWPNVLGPLLEFCRAPRRAPDLLRTVGQVKVSGRAFRVPKRALSEDLEVAKEIFRMGGLRAVARRGAGRIRRQIALRFGR